MKSILIFFSFFALITVKATGQASPTQSRFSYQRTVSLMGTVLNSTVEDLFHNEQESVYVTYAKDLIPPTDSTVTSKSGDRITIEYSGIGDGKDFTIYENYAQGIMVLRGMFSNGKKCIVNDVIPKFNWKLESEKKRIGQYECQKATTKFRCATYTVWFTTAIPLSIGPGKLSGLPGLIVEATNERAHITYKLLAADYPTSKKTYRIAPPNTGDLVYSYEAYRKIEIVEADKFTKFMMASADRSEGSPVLTQTPECLDK